MRHLMAIPNTALGLVALAGLASSALLVARGLTELAAADLGALMPSVPGPRAAPAAAPPPARDRSARAILARNPFDHTTGPLDGPRGPGNDEALVACSAIRVVTVVLSDDPSWSFVALRRQGEARSELRRTGAMFGGRTIEAIGYDRAWLGAPGAPCMVLLGRSDAPPPLPPGAATGAAPAASARGDDFPGVRRRSATEADVDRATVDRIIENHADLMRFVRVAPEKDGGRTVGLRLTGIRPGTLLAALGFEEGDRLETINGFDLASPEQALEAYARLRTAEHLVARVQRKGKPVELELDVR
jgi:general secretion pathway protein C